MDLVGGGVDSRGGYVSKILYVKTKELGLLEGTCAWRAPLDPPMLWAHIDMGGAKMIPQKGNGVSVENSC